jgi:hypothetical protein
VSEESRIRIPHQGPPSLHVRFRILREESQKGGRDRDGVEALARVIPC